MNRLDRQTIIKPLFECERNTWCKPEKTTVLIGEAEVQTVKRTAFPVPKCGFPAKQIIAVHVEVVDTTDTIFKNKVVKEGVFQVDIIYASCDGLVHHVCHEIPFMTSAHIKCVRPGMHVQNEVIDTEQKIEIVTTPRRGAKCQCFDVMVAATFLIRVTADVVKSPVQRHTVGRCCPHHKKTASSLRRKK